MEIRLQVDQVDRALQLHRQAAEGLWEALQASEYGFWANVNPKVPHPRWSQATEELIGTGERRPTLLFNGYGEYVADLYKGWKGAAVDVSLIRRSGRSGAMAPRAMIATRAIEPEHAMSTNQPNIGEIQRAVSKSLHDHWALYLVEGIVLLVLGARPSSSAAGDAGGDHPDRLAVPGERRRRPVHHLLDAGAPGFWWALMSAVLGIVAGVWLLAAPLRGAFSLTIILVAFFIIEGIASIMFALDHKRELSRAWGWMLVSGIVDLVLAAIIFAGLPGTAAWALGLLVGINMMFGGSALIAMALHARNAARVVRTAAHSRVSGNPVLVGLRFPGPIAIARRWRSAAFRGDERARMLAAYFSPEPFRQPPVVVEHRLQQHLRAGGALLLGLNFRLVVADAVACTARRSWPPAQPARRRRRRGRRRRSCRGWNSPRLPPPRARRRCSRGRTAAAAESRWS